MEPVVRSEQRPPAAFGVNRRAGFRGTVAGTVAIALARYLEARGIDGQAVLRDAGIRREVLNDRYSRIPATRFADALEYAARAQNDPCFGLHFGEWYRPPVLHPCNIAIDNSPDLRTALNFLVEHRNLVTDMPTRFDDGGMLAMLTWSIAAGDGPQQQLTDFKAMRTLLHIQKATGDDWRPLSLELTYPAPADVREHLRLFGGRPRFGQPENRFCFDASLLDLPMRRANPDLFNLATQTALLPQWSDSTPASSVVAVRRFVGKHLDSDRCTLQETANYVGVSRQRLARELKKHNTCFQCIVNETRQTFARHYLAHTNLRFSEIALMLGFSDQSAFTRAVKRWFGLPPREFRRGGA